MEVHKNPNIHSFLLDKFILFTHFSMGNPMLSFDAIEAQVNIHLKIPNFGRIIFS